MTRREVADIVDAVEEQLTHPWEGVKPAEKGAGMLWLGIPIGIALVGLGIFLWMYPKPPRIDFAFYQHYEPRALAALLCLVGGVAALLVGIFQS